MSENHVRRYAKQAYAILRTARGDTASGAKKDHQYRRNKRRPADRARRRPTSQQLALTKEADVILKHANFDITSGAKRDRRYFRNKRAERNRRARHWRAKSKKLGNFGAASPVRNIPPDGR